MAFALELSTLSEHHKKFILENCIIQQQSTQYDKSPAPLHCFKTNKNDDEILLPLNYWQYFSKIFPNGESNTYPPMNPNAKFTKPLLTVDTDPLKRNRDQNVICELALEKLKSQNSVFLALCTGFSKTATSIYLSIQLKLKTVILCHIDSVKQQWPQAYANFTEHVKVQYVKNKLDINADVYVVGIQKALNYDWFDIGTVIIDEAHIATVTAFTETLLKFRPRYLIGLSATFDRADGLHTLFYPYFGKDFIIRKEKKVFTVYKVNTYFEPTIEYKRRGGKNVPDWNLVVNSIEENPKRWEMIVNIILKNKQHKIIVLCNRKIQANGIYNLLKDKDDVALYIEDNKINKDKRVTIAGFKKAGVGYDDPNLTMAIIASDTKDVRQYEGRIRTTNNIIYHIVDDYSLFEKHYMPCRKWYLEKGATIYNINQYDDVIKNLILMKYHLKFMITDIVNLIIKTTIQCL